MAVSIVNEYGSNERSGRNQGWSRVKDKKLRSNLKRLDSKYKDAVRHAQSSEVLLSETKGALVADGLEKTYKFTQDQLKENVDLSTAQKSYELDLNEFGPYCFDYTRNGRYLLLGGRKGHVSAFDWREGLIQSELHLSETVRDVQWLHNENFYAVAQKKYVYIYDRAGVEVHCLKKHVEVSAMTFLPYHYLLATIGYSGILRYHDTSTGHIVTELKTKLGSCSTIAQNPYNAVVHLGHGNGTTTLWTPNMSSPVVKILAHRGPVRGLCIDRGGRYMVSAGSDNQLKVWDVRNYKEVHSYITPTPANSLSISDTGLLSVGWGPHVTVWKDALRTKQKSPYMTHTSPASPVSCVGFCPFEDILGVGHEKGFSSLVIPGAGEPNYDALEINPYETKKQRQEGEVRSLLTKIPSDMISLNPDFVGKLDNAASEMRKGQSDHGRGTADNDRKPKIKEKARGKNSSLRRHLRKRNKNVMDERKLKIEEALNREKILRQKRVGQSRGEAEPEQYGRALARFKR